MVHMLERQSRLFGASPFVRIGDVAWTHAQAAEVAAQRAACLYQAGVRQGDRVASWLDNRAEAIEMLWGCAWLGAVLVPINTASMAPQVQYVLQNSGAKMLVLPAKSLQRFPFFDFDWVDLQTVWVVDDGPELGPADDSFGTHAGVQVLPYPAGSSPMAGADLQPSGVMAILYTSGTTGPPKGVVCPHAQFWAWCMETADILAVSGEDVLFTTLPLFHINALNTVGQAMVQGCQVVIGERFSVGRYWAQVNAHEATVLYLLGAMVPMLMSQVAGPQELSHSVRLALGPGVPSSAGQHFTDRTGISLVNGYGSTETNFVIATPLGSGGEADMGWLRPGYQARVVDEQENDVPFGQAGQLLLRADDPTCFSCAYWGMPEQTEQAWRSGWFRTGDRVLQHADGHWTFIDRIKESMRRRGENISAWEVEQVVQMHPSVAAVAAFPVRSDLAEDEVMVAIVLNDGHVFDGPELVHFCAQRLPAYALPLFWDVVVDLPRTENGKVQKFKLVQRGVGLKTWQRPQPARRP